MSCWLGNLRAFTTDDYPDYQARGANGCMEHGCAWNIWHVVFRQLIAILRWKMPMKLMLIKLGFPFLDQSPSPCFTPFQSHPFSGLGQITSCLRWSLGSLDVGVAGHHGSPCTPHCQVAAKGGGTDSATSKRKALEAAGCWDRLSCAVKVDEAGISWWMFHIVPATATSARNTRSKTSN